MVENILNLNAGRRNLSARGMTWAAVLLLGSLPTVAQEDSDQDAPASQSESAVPEERVSDERIRQLIEQLGAPAFASRERAEEQLRQIGLRAFDDLRVARKHMDLEVALRARYILKTMRVDWFTDDDSDTVKRLLKNYGDLPVQERRARIDQVNTLEVDDKLNALCRLARFDESEVLSKYCATAILKKKIEGDSEDQARWARDIQDTMGDSRRPAADWLRAFAHSLVAPAETIDLWAQFGDDEFALLHRFPSRTSREVVRDLMRYQAHLLQTIGREEEAVAALRKTIELLDGTRAQLLETVDWLMEREAWDIVDEVAAEHKNKFDQYTVLLYRLAEAQHRRGEDDLAEETAKKAFEVEPENQNEHLITAIALRDRGRIEWAEREFDFVLDKGKPGTRLDNSARFLFSEMLHDFGFEEKAATVLKVVVDGIDNDKTVEQLVRSEGRDPGSVKSRMHFFFGRHFAEQGDWAKVKEHYNEGIKHDSRDADLLIGMYRVKDSDAEWREKTMALIKSATSEFERQIKEYREQLSKERDERDQDVLKRLLAGSHNQYAWLVSNTEGDFDAAVRSSHRSLELRPNLAGYLDTLGRCYYAKKDYKNAIKYQSQAVKLEPFSGQIGLQLKLFQKASAESTKDQS